MCIFLQDRIEKMATDIFHELNGRQMATLCVLKGGYKFYSDLLVLTAHFETLLRA